MQGGGGESKWSVGRRRKVGHLFFFQMEQKFFWLDHLSAKWLKTAFIKNSWNSPKSIICWKKKIWKIVVGSQKWHQLFWKNSLMRGQEQLKDTPDASVTKRSTTLVPVVNNLNNISETGSLVWHFKVRRFHHWHLETRRLPERKREWSYTENSCTASAQLWRQSQHQTCFILLIYENELRISFCKTFILICTNKTVFSSEVGKL